jgi:hypothetical protein
MSVKLDPFVFFYRKLPSLVDQCSDKDIEAYNPIYFTSSYRLVTFYINMLMPKLFKHMNYPTNVISAFDKPCIPLKMSMEILFMSRNGHDKNMTKMYGNGLMFWV